MVGFRLLRDGFTARDLRCAGDGFDAMLAQQFFADHFEVELAHAGDEALAGLLMGADTEGGVLIAEA